MDLYTAIRMGNINAVIEIFTSGISIDITLHQNQTPLMIACRLGKSAIAKYLLDNNANICCVDKYNNTVLHIAFKNRHFNILKTLSNYDIKNIINVKNDYDMLCIHYAWKYKRADIVYDLLLKGADIESLNEGNYTNLMYACEYNNLKLVDYLINHGANINLKNILNDTALLIACFYCQTAIIFELIKYGADVHVIDEEHKSCLIHLSESACVIDRYNIAKYLIDAGLNVNNVDDKNNISLFYACAYDNIPFIKLLLEHGSNINDENESLMTCLMQACLYRGCLI